MPQIFKALYGCSFEANKMLNEHRSIEDLPMLVFFEVTSKIRGLRARFDKKDRPFASSKNRRALKSAKPFVVFRVPYWPMVGEN